MSKQTFRVTLEVTVDPEEIVNGLPNGNPARWNWELLLRGSDINAEVEMTDAFIACCESKIDWATNEDRDTREVFEPYFHDTDCVNYLTVEQTLGIEEDAV